MDPFEEFSPIEWDQADMQLLAESRHHARMPEVFGTFELFSITDCEREISLASGGNGLVIVAGGGAKGSP